MARRPEDVAAVVNGLLVLVVPIAALLILASIDPRSSDTSTTVTARDPERLSMLLELSGTLAMTLAPFALLAAWRTRVHARRWREHGDRGWLGVFEAGILGFGVAILVLAPGIVTRPLEAPPYVIVYGGAALVLGLVVGLLLRFATLGVLKWRNASVIRAPRGTMNQS